MSDEAKTPRPDREQTDESLRVEREKVDHALGEKLAAIDENADAVLIQARELADDVLATARRRVDTQPATSPQAPAILERERAREDNALRHERADADALLHAERAENAALLSLEREETDNDLLTERVRSDDAIATRDDFLSIVSHDLRNLLQGLIGFAGLIEHEVSQENHVEPILMLARSIHRSGDRMNRLIGDLVDLASIEAGKLAVSREIGDPTHVATEAVDTFQGRAVAKGVSLDAHIVPPSSLASFDRGRILQVLANLLSNAIKFTPRGGKIVVRVERPGDEIRFTVSDSGSGIPPQKLQAVFERFLQVEVNDRRGLGLGLYIAKCIVEAHGGRIWADSTMGVGSAFCFTLPAHVAS